MNEEVKPQEKLNLLSIGDATMDTYIVPTESETLCQMDDKDSLICFSYGDKIPVKSIDFSVGGNAANNAVGTRRLGIKSGLVSTLGADLVGNQILEKLTDESVDLTYVIQQPNATSNYSTVINYGGERTIFTYHAPRSYEFPVHLPATEWVYLTSMGESFGPFYKHLAGWINKNPDVKLAFNPGSRQLRAGVDSLKNIMEKTYLIYVNRREAEMLTGMDDTHNKEKELLKVLSALGPKICVITDGGNGSFVYDGSRFIKAGILPVDAYERTGAGDSFGSGMLSALIKGKDFEEALLWGSVNSASVIGYIGPQKGLLHDSEMPAWVERARSSDVKVGEF
jgi:ribokinase